MNPFEICGRNPSCFISLGAELPGGRGCEAGKYRSFDRRTHDMIPTSDFGVEVRTIARMDSPFDRQIYEWSVLVVTAGASCFDAYILTFSPFAISCIPFKPTLIHQRYAMDSTKMQYRFLGNTGTKVSVISLGGWLTHGGHTGNEVAKQTMKAAYEAGVNFFDSVSTRVRLVGSLGSLTSVWPIWTRLFVGRRIRRRSGREALGSGHQRVRLGP
jgi:hypothetical protein